MKRVLKILKIHLSSRMFKIFNTRTEYSEVVAHVLNFIIILFLVNCMSLERVKGFAIYD